ncbi:hypothetical protein [Pseudomonas sp. NA-150]|uniref:hypothetical protein n=1 Tax=Pseudomonas sp. NA-150 TaxID=3367525 RepID=UPI0037C53622
MDIESFHRDIIETVRAKAEFAKNFISAGFVDECGERLVDAEEMLVFESCRFEGVSNKKKLRVDGYSFDDTDSSLSLVIAEFYNDDEISSFVTQDVKRTFELLRSFLEEALDGNLTDGTVDESQPGYGLACDLMDWHTKISKYRFYFVSNGLLKTRQKGWLEENVKGIPAELHIWDINRFHTAYMSATGRDDLVVDFSNVEGKGLPCLAAAQSEGEY